MKQGAGIRVREKGNRFSICKVVNVVSARTFKPKWFAARVCSGTGRIDLAGILSYTQPFFSYTEKNDENRNFPIAVAGCALAALLSVATGVVAQPTPSRSLLALSKRNHTLAIVDPGMLPGHRYSPSWSGPARSDRLFRWKDGLCFHLWRRRLPCVGHRSGRTRRRCLTSTPAP